MNTKKNVPDSKIRHIIWWREVDSNHRSKKQQIYSLPPLATREPLRIKLCFAKLSRIAATLIVYHVSKYLSTLFFNFFQIF